MYAVDKKNHYPWDKKLKSKYILCKSSIYAYVLTENETKILI